MLIPNICKKANLTPKQGALVQVSLFSIVFISIFLFTNFYVTLSIYLAILAPLFLLYVYVFQNLYQGLRQLNLAS